MYEYNYIVITYSIFSDGLEMYGNHQQWFTGMYMRLNFKFKLFLLAYYSQQLLFYFFRDEYHILFQEKKG